MKSLVFDFLRTQKKTWVPLAVNTMARAFGSRLFFMVNGAFDDEKRAVLAGSVAHFEGERQSNHQMFLRRSVHRIEKGLISKPMRVTFAADYIERTVATYAKLGEHGHSDLGEAQWARDVLARYFEATSESTNEKIVRARSHWLACDPKEPVSDADLSPFPYFPMTAGTQHFDAISHVASNRRSVRWFHDKAVPRELVEAAAAIGATAPSACNRQSYRLELLEDDVLRKEVAAIPMGTAGFAEQIPLLAVLIGQHRGYEHHRDRHAIYVDGGLFSAGFLLALESLGLSTCCINWPEIPALNLRIGRSIGLQEDERVIMLIAIGYGLDGQLVPRSHKRELEGLVKWR